MTLMALVTSPHHRKIWIIQMQDGRTPTCDRVRSHLNVTMLQQYNAKFKPSKFFPEHSFLSHLKKLRSRDRHCRRDIPNQTFNGKAHPFLPAPADCSSEAELTICTTQFTVVLDDPQGLWFHEDFSLGTYSGAMP